MQNEQAVTKKSACVHHFEEFDVRHISGTHGIIIFAYSGEKPPA
jgi:hypothetical protein